MPIVPLYWLQAQPPGVRIDPTGGRLASSFAGDIGGGFFSKTPTSQITIDVPDDLITRLTTGYGLSPWEARQAMAYYLGQCGPDVVIESWRA